MGIIHGVVVVTEMQVFIVRLLALEVQFLRLNSPCDLSEFLRKEPFFQQSRRASVTVCKRMDTYADKMNHTGVIEHLVVCQIGFLMHDIDVLVKADLSYDEVFYYAGMIHLVCVSIHPFADGNGRSSRLLEKWFLAQKLGQVAWAVQSEKLYYSRRKSYYENLHFKGDNYTSIDYTHSIPFLCMLPMALNMR